MKFSLTEVDIKTNEEIRTTELEIDITQEELDEYSKLFCNCNYLQEHPNKQAEYVEHYKGVSHGWICPKCKKFVQIG